MNELRRLSAFQLLDEKRRVAVMMAISMEAGMGGMDKETLEMLSIDNPGQYDFLNES